MQPDLATVTQPGPLPAGPAAGSTAERLIASAVELIAEHGAVEQVSLRSIAAGAGVSPTAVYRHFADHEALVTATVRWCWHRFDRTVNHETAHIADPYRRLQAQGRVYVRFALEQPGVYRVLFSTAGLVGVVREDVGLPVFMKLVDTVGAVLDASHDQRQALTVATQVFSWVHGIADLRLTGVDLPWEPVETQVDSLLHSLRLLPIES
ncbi:MAG: TetR/AcrR family transcriptional regulator [Actinomycetota bacterium]